MRLRTLSIAPEFILDLVKYDSPGVKIVSDKLPTDTILVGTKITYKYGQPWVELVLDSVHFSEIDSKDGIIPEVNSPIFERVY